MPQQTLSRRLSLALGLFAATLVAGAANAAAAAESPARIAWFYKPPGDGTSAARLIEKTQQIILTKGDESFLAQLRGAGYGKPIPQYIDTPYARGPANVLSSGAPCDASYATFRNVVTWFPGDFCRYINQHEDWFLHNGAGKRLYKAESNGGWKYLMNPASAGWRQFTRDRVRQALVGDAEGGPFGYNGIFADDVWVSLHQPKNKMSNSDGSVLEYSSDAGWQTAMKGLLAGIRTETHAAGYKMWANLEGSTKGGPYSASVDSYMVENFAGSWSGSYASESDTKAVWSLVERDVASGKTVLLVGQGSSSSDTERGAFAYAAYLMVAGPSVLFRYASVNDYKSFWWLPEYDVPLGTPLGSRYLEGDSTWRRDFTGGIALVNLSSSSSRTVQLGGEFLRNGSPVTSVTVGPRRGVLLTRAGEPLPAPPPPAPGAPLPTLPPTISGATRENGTLTASTGTWEGDPSGFSYQWVRCEKWGGGCAPLEGEVEPTFTTTAADLGRRLRVVVTAVNEQGATAADSALTEVVRGSKPRRVRLRAHSRVATASAFLRRTRPTHVVRTRIRGRILVGAPLRWQVERAADNRRRVVTLLRKKRGAWRVLARVHTTSAGRFQVRREIKTDRRTIRVKAVARYVGFKARSAPVRTRTLG